MLENSDSEPETAARYRNILARYRMIFDNNTRSRDLGQDSSRLPCRSWPLSSLLSEKGMQ